MGGKFRVAIIGAGMSGIAAAVQLQNEGIDFQIFEKADRVGGTWRENTYPGLSCDVPAHLYTYSFARNPEWPSWHAPGPDIQKYFEQVTARFDLAAHMRMGDEVTRLAFEDGAWTLETKSGFKDRFQAVIAATGVLHHPNIPDLPGLESFAGRKFHTARWDHGVDLGGKRVGLIGTGSTAVQIVAALADRVQALTIFQRTAQWVHPMETRVYSPDERARFAQDPAALEALITRLRDTFSEAISNAVIDAASPEMRAMEARCEAFLNTVRDPVLREKLRPNYRAGCKRLVFSSDFYEAVQKPNVDVVTSGIAAVEPRGIRTADGAFHALDVLILATGFRVDRFVRPIIVTGRNGVDLNEVWSRGPKAYLSIALPEFPNFFMLNGPGGPVGNISLIDVAEHQLHYLMQLIKPLRDGNFRSVEPTAAALDGFETERRAAAKATIWSTGCNSWYLGADDVPAVWTFSWRRFLAEMKSPRLDHYEFN